MINVLHLYYDLLNLYGENANTRCIKEELTRSNIKVKVGLKSTNDKIDFEKYDIIYIGSGSEESLELALEDILKRKDDFKKYIESNKYLILTGNSMALFGKYIKTKEAKLDALDIFDYYTEYITEASFKNASSDRIVGEIKGKTKLIKETIIGFQNRCDYIYNVKTPLLEVDEKFSNDGTNNKEGFTYKNVYATHTIGPLLIRNPYLTDCILKSICKTKKLDYKIEKTTAKEAYKKYLENFN